MPVTEEQNNATWFVFIKVHPVKVVTVINVAHARAQIFHKYYDISRTGFNKHYLFPIEIEKSKYWNVDQQSLLRGCVRDRQSLRMSKCAKKKNVASIKQYVIFILYIIILILKKMYSNFSWKHALHLFFSKLFLLSQQHIRTLILSSKFSTFF